MVRFRPARELTLIANAALARERGRLGRLVPEGELVLTGASSHPELLTAGDIDLHLRVPGAAFDAAVAALQGVYEIVHPEIWGPGFATFGVRDTDPPVGVAVTRVGGEHDRRFLAAWRVLATDPATRAAYNRLKREHAGGRDDAYRAAKAGFFDRLARRADSGRPQ